MSEGRVRVGRRHPEVTTAQVFARDTRLPDEAPLIYLGQAQADAFRDDAREGRLVCPIGDCDDRRLIVRAGSRRDHFAHRHGAGRHAAETIQHHTAKNLVGMWLRTRYPTAHIDVDTIELENGRRPDVLLRLLDGQRVGYEVQFAALTEESWAARHADYEAAGVRDVWLFGGRRYDRVGRGHAVDDRTRALPPVFEAVLARRHPMLLIDPSAGTVAFGDGPAVTQRLQARGTHPERLLHGQAIVETRWPIANARAASGVIDLPGLRAQMTNADDEHHRLWLEVSARAKSAQAERAAALHAEWLEAAARREVREQRARERRAVWRPARATTPPAAVPVPRPRVHTEQAAARQTSLWSAGALRPEPVRRGALEVERQHPEYGQWAAIQSWAAVSALPDDLRRTAMACAYVATVLSVAGPIADLPLQGLGETDQGEVLAALVADDWISLETRGGVERWRAMNEPAD
ncbi:competence protein CoiA family protein [Cellulomonas soli]|uniref:Competence protein CoiA nuclease-like domain-containing protein n=1 Tax=Cellulomonas soli TaxID=931535 RepID=A0A512PIL3_9CELL|nr:competence protein CoiA family protein [Cellulomonas soli]NYI57459.1 hypothetical protein [Cellulomonas soli]GEP71023.1 hypothetical protein CSO01_37380 [Cellulomonas soli]